MIHSLSLRDVPLAVDQPRPQRIRSYIGNEIVQNPVQVRASAGSQVTIDGLDIVDVMDKHGGEIEVQNVLQFGSGGVPICGPG